MFTFAVAREWNSLPDGQIIVNPFPPGSSPRRLDSKTGGCFRQGVVLTGLEGIGLINLDGFRPKLPENL